MGRVAERLDAAALPYRRARVFVDFPGALDYVFIGPRNASPTDRPEHFAHANTSEALVSVWLAADDLSAERRLLTTLGARIERRGVRVPEPTAAEVARLDEGTVVFLRGSRQIVRGRRIVGATVRVRGIEKMREALRDNGLQPPAAVDTAEGLSVFLPPAMTHGLWLEFRQPR
jgi:hypothetical protein